MPACVVAVAVYDSEKFEFVIVFGTENHVEFKRISVKQFLRDRSLGSRSIAHCGDFGIMCADCA